MLSDCPPSVLVIDDEPHVCALIEDCLRRSGVKCSTTTDSRQASELLDSRQFHVIIADIAMPHISGIDLLARARQVAPQCKFILITGKSQTEHLSQALNLGAYDFLQKPFNMEQLVESVRGAYSSDSPVHNLSDKAAKAMQQASSVRQVSLQAIQALVLAVEAKDPYTRRHSEQVAHYSVNLAEHLNLPQPMVESVRVAALLHDVGKIGIPDFILTKPGPLTQEEFLLIRRHPALGSDILQNISMLNTEASLVRHHHERWDGRGYPDGLTGEETPLGARIIHVADCMDAMLMERTYKRSFPVERVLNELRRCACTQFDPALAAAALEWCAAHPERIIRPPAAA